MKVHVITTFDKNHLGRFLAFRESLSRHAKGVHVHYLCLDRQTYDMGLKLNVEDSTPMLLEHLNDKELEVSRGNRTTPELASTAKPAFLLYMMKSGIVAKDDLLVFIDPDFYFYADAFPMFEKAYNSGVITITPHRFPAHRDHEKYKKGIYNAGIVFFRNDPEALACLSEWRKQCIEWCFLRFENGQIGDQGYLSEWPKKYKGVYEMVDNGVNLSTWNIENYKITEKGNNWDISGSPLICFHFHGLKIYFDGRGTIQAAPITVYHKGIYAPCVVALNEAYKILLKADPSWKFGTVPEPGFLRLMKQRVSKVFS